MGIWFSGKAFAQNLKGWLRQEDCKFKASLGYKSKM
jgi:hypothetical protein